MPACGEGGWLGENSKRCPSKTDETGYKRGVEVTGGNRQDDTLKLDPHHIRISHKPPTKRRSMAIVRVAWASRRLLFVQVLSDQLRGVEGGTFWVQLLWWYILYDVRLQITARDATGTNDFWSCTGVQ